MPSEVFKARTDLPATMMRDIGRLVVRYAFLEQYMQNVIYMLLGVSQGVGRMAVREPGRLSDKLELVIDLVAAKRFTLPDEVDIKALREGILDTMDTLGVRRRRQHGTHCRPSAHAQHSCPQSERDGKRRAQRNNFAIERRAGSCGVRDPAQFHSPLTVASVAVASGRIV